MAARRALTTMPGNGGAMVGGQMPMPPRPGLMGRANNPRPGMPGPQSGAAGGAMGGPMPSPGPQAGAGPGAGPGAMPGAVPGAVPPPQPTGGGPGSPLNIQGSGMLQNRMGQTPGQGAGPGAGPGAAPPMPGSPNPLPPWGGNSGGAPRRSITALPGDEAADALGTGNTSDPLSAVAGAGARAGAQPGQQPGEPGQPTDPSQSASMSPIVMLRMLKAMGRI